MDQSWQLQRIVIDAEQWLACLDSHYMQCMYNYFIVPDVSQLSAAVCLSLSNTALMDSALDAYSHGYS